MLFGIDFLILVSYPLPMLTLKPQSDFWLWLILFFITNTVKLDIDSLETLESREMKCRILQSNQNTVTEE